MPGDSLFRDLCEHTGIALIALDTGHRIRFWNAAASRVFGGSPEERLGQPLEEIVPEERRGLARRALERALRQGEVSQFEIRHVVPSGESRYLAVTVSPIIDRQGQHVGVSIGIRDVTYGMELVREVAETQRMSSLEAMAGAVSHHFNNLLGGIMTTIDFAHASGDPAQTRRALRATADALNRVQRLMRSLLVFAEGDHAICPSVNVRELIEQFVERHRAEWAESSIEVEVDLSPVEAALPTLGFTSLLEIVTDNACESMSSGGKLRISLHPEGEDRFKLVIGDEGCGVSEEHLQRVFDPFFTTKRSLETTDFDHLGLGLAVVHGMVRDWGGTVRLGRSPEGGTRCIISLPARIMVG